MTAPLKIITLMPRAIAILAGRTGFGATAEVPDIAALTPEQRALLEAVLSDDDTDLTDHGAVVDHGYKLCLDGVEDELLTYVSADETIHEALPRVLDAEISLRASLAAAILADVSACIRHFPEYRVGHRWIDTGDEGPYSTLRARDKAHPAVGAVVAEAALRNDADVAAWKAALLAGQIAPDKYGDYRSAPTALNSDPEVQAYIAATKAVR